MRYIYTLCFLLICSWGRTQAPELLTKKEAKFVSGIFAGEFLAESVPLPVREPAYEGLVMDGDRMYLFKNQWKVLGYLLSTRAKGRYDYFDYSVAFSEDLTVLGLIITVYRSSHGAAICQKRWLSQFKGYQGEELSLGKEVDALSGATISATSLVADIRRVHLLIRRLENDGKMP
ncbi:MAG: hypothetical protein P1P86_09080 [Bacteroidales bacterium]|nr:hypothetical protein [Bacteroidales bacterium]